MAEPIATNKKAYHNFHLQQKWECGLVLTGPEVKSLRAGYASFTDAYASVNKGEVFVHNLHIMPYKEASYNNAEAVRPRKLLMHRHEIEKVNGALTRQGLTLVPTKIYFTKKGLVKIEIALAQGKNLYDKRQDLKKKEVKREIDRAVRNLPAGRQARRK